MNIINMVLSIFTILTILFNNQMLGKFNSVTNLSLETGKQVDQEWMTHRVSDFENPLLAEQ